MCFFFLVPTLVFPPPPPPIVPYLACPCGACHICHIVCRHTAVPRIQVQWLFGQCLSVLQERGADMAEFDRDADLLQMLLYY